jgi:hypothetical protein
MLGLRRAVGTEVVHWLGANKPAYKLDPGFLEHPRLSPRAVIGPGARFLDFLFTGAPRRRRNPGGGGERHHLRLKMPTDNFYFCKIFFPSSLRSCMDVRAWA